MKLINIVSLFPPFEFGNEKLRTISERRINYKIENKLPVKRYDFIFGDNRKHISLSTYNIEKKFYSKDSLEYYKNLWGEENFRFNSESIDTFLTASRFLYKRAKYDYEFGFIDVLLFNKENRIIKYDNNNRSAVNYKEVKDKYEKSPEDWSYKYVYKIDSIKKYYEYTITRPKYYLLKREILFSELVIEYILAFFVSLIVGFSIQKIKSRMVTI